MIEPLARGEPYPSRLPPVRTQWLRMRRGVRYAVVGVPVAFIALFFAINPDIGLVALVLFGGAGVASVVYVKNRTDRHNAAIDRGEIRVVADPHLRPVAVASLGPDVLGRLAALGFPAADLGEVTHFEGGWIAKRRDRHALGVVVGDDGEFARFDPTCVDDLRAASEYRAGRGREPASR
jgi:hypothetical protein